jgi:type II secretory pathway pseudopilin PulG
MRYPTQRRSAFTLVEVMVAMALTIFVMTILTQAFVVSIETFVGLKAIGDMQENLRAAGNVLRFDLSQNHLEGTRRVSDPTMDPTNPALYQTPKAGFLRIVQGAASTTEGYDTGLTPLDLPSARATNHVLWFTCRLKGNRQQNFFTAQVIDPLNPNNAGMPYRNFFNIQTIPGTLYDPSRFQDADATLRPVYANFAAPYAAINGPPYFYRSQVAEVVYFLGNPGVGAFQAIGTTENPSDPNATGTPLYGLYRAQFVAVPDNTQLNTPNNPNNVGAVAFPSTCLANFPGMACVVSGTNLSFLTPENMASGTGTTNRTWDSVNLPFRNASLVLPNVISFQVQTVSSASTAPADMSAPYPAVFDTTSGASTTGAPNAIVGISINIRVWDIKTRQTRQMTIMQDL